MASTLLSGNKSKLIGDFQRLQVIHGKKWRRLLRAHNNWHGTEEAANAWKNAKRGVAGNEVLRQIVADMSEIVEKEAIPELV